MLDDALAKGRLPMIGSTKAKAVTMDLDIIINCVVYSDCRLNVNGSMFTYCNQIFRIGFNELLMTVSYLLVNNRIDGQC